MALDASTIGALRAGFTGDIVTTDDEAYEMARRVWNVMIERQSQPAAVLATLQV